MDKRIRVELTVNISTLRDLRMAHGLNLEETAAKCGIASGYWNELEAGKRRGSPKEIDAIAGGSALLNRSSRPSYRSESSLTTTTAGR